MIYYRTCRYCGEQFETKDGRQHYCSAECRLKANSVMRGEYIRRYRNSHPEYCKRMSDKVNEYQKKKRMERYYNIADDILAKRWTTEDLSEYLISNFCLKKGK